MALFRGFNGRFSGSFASIGFTKEGDWEGCAIRLNNLAHVSDVFKDGLQEIAQSIIVPALNSTKESGNFAANTALTSRIKGGKPPWNGLYGDTGEAEVSGDNGSGGLAVRLSGDQSIVFWVNNGFYSTWAHSNIDGRDLFGKTWDSCEGEVKSAVDNLLQQAVNK